MRAKTKFSSKHARMPLELFVLVTDVLSHGHASTTLAQLALVSRGLKRIATPALYRTIFLGKGDEAATSFASTVTSNTVLASLVRVLSAPHGTSVLNSIIVACPKIEILHCLAPPPQQEFANAVRGLSNLRSLFFDIQHVEYDAALGDVIFPGLKSLQVLSFDRISCEDWRITLPLLSELEEVLCAVSFSDAFQSLYRVPHFLSNMLKRHAKLRRVRCVLFGYNLRARRQVEETKQLLAAIRDSRFSFAVLNSVEDASQMHVLHLQGKLSLWDLEPEKV